jgi:hypothetical protein
MRTIFFGCVVLLCSTAFAQLELSQQAMSRLVDVAAVETIDDLVFVETGSAITTKPVVILTATTDAANVQVEASDMARMPVEFRDLGGGRYLFEKPEKAWVDVTVIDFAKNIFAKKTVVVEVGISPPTPPGPTPVPPGPQPVPPSPTPPTPSVAPIEGPGLRVLMVVESGEPLELPIQDVLYGRKVRDFMTANCIKVDGVADWRIVDPDTQYTDREQRFAKALQRPRTSVPWLIISNGVTGYEGPFPGGPDATLTLIQSFATPGPAPTPQPQPPAPPTPQPQPEPQPAGVAKVVLYARAGCLWCDKWKSMEQANFEAKPGVELQIIEDVARKFPNHPTFVLTKNGRTKTLVGYQTADKLAQEAAAL